MTNLTLNALNTLLNNTKCGSEFRALQREIKATPQSEDVLARLDEERTSWNAEISERNDIEATEIEAQKKAYADERV